MAAKGAGPELNRRAAGLRAHPRQHLDARLIVDQVGTDDEVPGPRLHRRPAWARLRARLAHSGVEPAGPVAGGDGEVGEGPNRVVEPRVVGQVLQGAPCLHLRDADPRGGQVARQRHAEPAAACAELQHAQARPPQAQRRLARFQEGGKPAGSVPHMACGVWWGYERCGRTGKSLWSQQRPRVWRGG